MSRGFPPILAPRARVLVLGTLPSVKSLEKHEYYGHPQNAFWPIMGELFGAGPELGYAERTTRLAEAGVAVWDVLAEAEREGSGDDAIESASAVPNDIAGLLRDNPGISRVFFNGGPAEALFGRFVLPNVPEGFVVPPLVRLPSTSPRFAKPLAWKLAAWRAVADAVEEG